MHKSSLIDSKLLFKVINASCDGIVIAEKEGEDTILIYVNDAFELMTGYTADEILYKDCRFLQGTDTDQIARKQLKDAIQKNEACVVRLRNYRKDGSMFWNELSMTPFYNEDDKATYFIGIQKDVTKEVELIDKLKAANNNTAEL